MKPIITIVIPSYNKEHYIKRCIDSALSQNIPKKVMVIDNKSSDRTRDIVNAYWDELIKIQNSTNLWMAWNWNMCIQHCDTELLLILHADDELLPNILSYYVDFYANHKNIGMIHAGSFTIFESSGKKIQLESDFQEIRKAWKDALNKAIWEPNIRCSTVVVPKKVYEDVWVYLTDSLSSDVEMWARIAKNYDIWYISHPTANIHVNDASTGKNSLLDRSVKDVLADRDNLNNVMLSYYLPKDKKQAIKYANKSIIVWLIIIIYTVLDVKKQYWKIFTALYYIVFKYHALSNPIVLGKVLPFIYKKIRSFLSSFIPLS